MLAARRIFQFSRVIHPTWLRTPQKRSIHLSSWLGLRKFLHKETEFNMKFVPQYEIDLQFPNSRGNFVLDADYSGKSPEELVAAFEKLSHHCSLTKTCISESSHDNLVYHLTKTIDDTTDDQLLNILSAFSQFPEAPSTYSNNFHELFNALDATCCRRVRTWKNPMLLKVCNLWLKLHMSKVGEFTGRAITKICRRADRLPAKTLVEAMFYQTVNRWKIDMIPVESRFFEVIDELNFNEIGIICLAYFKCESKIKTFELIDRIFDKAIEAVRRGKVEDITLVNVLKTLRYSSYPGCDKKMEELLEALLPVVKDDATSLIALLHISLLGTNLQLCNQKILEAVVARFNRDIKKARLKDIERLTFAIGLYDFKSEFGTEQELLKKVIEELKLRVEEVVNYPKCLSSTAHYLTLCGLYDLEIIETVLGKKFIDFAYQHNAWTIGREILSLDSYTKINLADVYKGPTLFPKIRSEMTRIHTDFVPVRGQPYKLTHSDKILLDIKEFMEENYGENRIVHILPHYQRPDIVYCFDKNRKSITNELFTSQSNNYFRGQILSKEFLLKNHDNQDDLKTFAVVIGGWNFFLRNSNRPVGGLRLKVEQLEKIGHEVILIHWNEWNLMSSNEKKNYLDEILDQKLGKL